MSRSFLRVLLSKYEHFLTQAMGGILLYSSVQSSKFADAAVYGKHFSHIID